MTWFDISNIIKIALFSLVLAILIYPGLEKLYLYKQTIKLEDLVMAPLGFLGENQTILSNDDKFTRYGTKYEELDLLPNRDLFIGIKNEFKFHERWVNLSKERNRVFNERLNQLKDVGNKIKNKEYSLVVYGPYTNELDLYYLATLNTTNKNENKEVLPLDSYCEVFLTSTEHRCTDCKSLIRVFFRENESCDKITRSIVDHYKKKFYKICQLEGAVSNYALKAALTANGFFIIDKCEEGGRVIAGYESKTFRIYNLLSILYISIIILIFILVNYRSKLFYFLLIIMIIFIVPLHLYNKAHPPGYYVDGTYYRFLEVALPPELEELEESRSVNYKGYAKVVILDPRAELSRYS